MNKLSVIALAIGSILTASPALAQDDELALLKKQLQAQQELLLKLQQKLEELEEKNAEDDKKEAESVEVAATQPTTKPHSVLSSQSEDGTGFTFSSYGNVLYKSAEIFANVQDTDPERRDRVDLERVVTEFGYKFNEHWEVEAEIEYEHGGTGSTLEYDGFEEFGEFESEVEVGGEVVVEKLEVKYTHNENFAVKFGHIYVPVGMGTDLNKPTQYYTTQRHWSEATMIPQVWHETGINLIGKYGDFTFQGLVTTGLNSEYFRTNHWVATGMQERFEYANADDLAYTFRADYGDVKAGKGFGFSYYTGDTTGNRHNSGKMEGDGNVSIYGVHGAWTIENLTVRGQYLYGELDDAEEITQANKTTPGLKPGNFALVGSESESVFVEAGYNVQELFDLTSPLTFFASYDYANPTKRIPVGIPSERFNISEWSMGINYLPIEQIILKLQGSRVMYEQAGLDDTNTLSMSVGYYFSL